MQKLRQRMYKLLAQVHPVSKWWKQNSHLGIPIQEYRCGAEANPTSSWSFSQWPNGRYSGYVACVTSFGHMEELYPQNQSSGQGQLANSSHKTLVKSLSLSFFFFVFNIKASSNIFLAGLLERRVQLKQMIEYQVCPALNRAEDVMSADRGPGSNTTSFIYYHETLRRSPLRVSFVLSVK